VTDILTDVLDALQLQATAIERVALPTQRHEEVTEGHAALIIVVDGRCTVTAESGERVLLAGDYVLLFASGALHNGLATPTHLLRCSYTLQTRLPHPLADQLPPMITTEERSLTDETEFGHAVAMLDREIVNARLGSEFVIRRLEEVAFVEALRRTQLDGASQPTFLSALADPVVTAALELIHRDPGRPWHVEELARGVGLSRAAFAERFHRHVGIPPLTYLRAWRMLKARHELLQYTATVRAVAGSVGYRSVHGFSRAFRRFFGHSPSALRGQGRR
jgi:AraC-like DNA-binding protein